MSALAPGERLELTQRTLAEFSHAIDPLGADRWAVTLENAWPRIHARARGGWLFLEAPGSVEGSQLAVPPGEVLAFLERNGRFPGGVRFLFTDGGRVLLRSEIPLDEDIDLPRRIQDALDGFRLALQPDRAPEARGADVSRSELSVSELRDLCVQTGWEIHERGDGLPSVRLECPRSPRQATFAAWAEGVRVTVDIIPGVNLGPVSQDAAWIFLLSAGGFLRMVRPAVGREEGQPVPRFEVAWGSQPAVLELEHAFSALSVACELCAEELGAFQDPNFAGEYLAIRGWSP